MSTVETTREQRDAIVADLDSFTVRASAGSGKTTVLVQRYLRLVTEQGLRPDEILTITFTRKAAAEMKGRIVRALKDLGRVTDAQTAETGPIQTIHSLCERILRENSLAAGLDPGFEVMDETAKSALIEEAVRWCLTTPLEEHPNANVLVAALAGRQVYDATHTVHVKLWAAIREVLGQLRGSGKSTAELREDYRDPESVKALWHRELVCALPPDVAQALGELDPVDGAKAIVAQMKAGRHKLPEWLKPGMPLWSDDSAVHTCGLMQLSLLAWEWMEDQMKIRQELDFTLLESKAVRLVHESAGTAERLRAQYKAMLVDEAQDVNPVQYRLLEALRTGSEMMVGDPQQSIYGFRLADRELFIDRTERLPNVRLSRNFRSSPGILRFVDDFYTRLWSDEYQAMSEKSAATDPDDPFADDGGLDYSGVEAWMQDAKDTNATASAIAALIKEGVKANEIAVLTRLNSSSHEIADRLNARGIATRVIGGSERFYTRLEVRDVANALDALAFPYANFQLLALLRSPFVGVSLDSIALLALQDRVIDALDEFVPPVDGDRERINEFLQWFRPLSRAADRVPAWETVAALINKTRYFETIAARPNAAQTIANVRKLFMLAAQEPLLGAEAFAEKIRQVQELRHREGDAPSIDEDADAVTLMTIHRAKGLEFDVVVLPDMHKEFGRRRRGDVLIDARSGTVMTRFAKTGSKTLDTVCWKQLFSRLNEVERKEQVRVLYVGMTRAKRRLCVVVSSLPSDKTPAGLVTSRMGLNDGTLPGLVVRRAESG